MLDQRTQVSIRRHLGVPAYGIPNTSFTLGIQVYDPELPPERQAATVDARMQNLTPTEESYITGFPVAQIALTGLASAASSVAVTANQSGTSVPLGLYTLTAIDALSPLTLVVFAVQLVSTINNASIAFTAAMGPNTPGSIAVAPYASFTVASLTNNPFTISVNAQGVGAYPVMQGTSVAMSAKLDGIVVSGLVPILDALEARIAGSSNYAAYSKADVVSFDPLEDHKRQRVYERMRRRLAEFFGIGVDPLGLFSGRGAIA